MNDVLAVEVRHDEILDPLEDEMNKEIFIQLQVILRSSQSNLLMSSDMNAEAE